MVFLDSHGLTNFMASPPQTSCQAHLFQMGFCVKFVKSWNIIHKLPSNIPSQIFVHLHFFGPLGFKFCVKWINTLTILFFQSWIFYFDGHGLLISSYKRGFSLWMRLFLMFISNPKKNWGFGHSNNVGAIGSPKAPFKARCL